MTIREQVRDQGAHFGVAVVAVGLAASGNPLACALAGLLCGMIREVTEEGVPVTWGKIKAATRHSDAPMDLAFWTLGGFAAGLVL